MKNIIFIFIGGGIGSVFRFLMQRKLPLLLFHSVPFGTLAVNVIGSFLIGCFYVISEKWALSLEIRLFLTTGLCGGFTTFSTFSYENMLLLRQGDYFSFTFSVFLNVFCCIAGVFAGVFLFRKLG